MNNEKDLNLPAAAASPQPCQNNPLPVVYAFDGKGNIVLPDGAPFDGKSYLVLFSKGWVESWWAKAERHETSEGTDFDGFFWVCADDTFQSDLDEAKFWLPLPPKPVFSQGEPDGPPPQATPEVIR